MEQVEGGINNQILGVKGLNDSAIVAIAEKKTSKVQALIVMIQTCASQILVRPY